MALRIVLVALAVLLIPRPGLAENRVSELQHEIANTIATAREELHSLDELLRAADSRAVQKELHRKAEKIDELLATIPRLASDLERAVGHSEGTSTSVGVSLGGLGGLSGDVVVVVDDHDIVPVVVVEEIHHDDVHHHAPSACSESDFAAVVQAVENESFSRGKLEALTDASVDRWYTSAQVTRMLEGFAFDDGKVDAAVVMHPKVVDMENWFTVHSAFTFDSSKEELRRRVGR
jgi:hypothetical protein